jgi:ABC-type multidrug transport system ATPase subunit
MPSKQAAKKQTGYTTIPLDTVGEDETSTSTPAIHAEEDPTHLPVGVSIQNLVKIYSGKKRAVDNLSLNFYEGQITSFLGHNGAGKTTTMSVLCGLFPPSSGTAYIRGLDIACDIDEIRKTLGFCPQQNTLYNKMTVSEHLWFFAKMKNVGAPNKKLKQEVDKWINELNLVSKRNARVGSLSGGMKRKLSVAMAYVGDSRVVVLDEPTAGVDPYARRGIWDLMFKHRENRTILLSTHYMDEADVLGDRIAIISHGKLCCVGSSMYLKHQLCDGYYLSLAKQPQGSVTSLALSGTSGVASTTGSASCDISGSLPVLSHSPCMSVASNESVNATGILSDVGEVFISSDGRQPPTRNAITHRRNRSEGSAMDFVAGLGQKKGSKKKLNFSCATESVTRLIQSHVHGAQLMEDIGSELTYLLPTKEGNGHELSLLLRDLDRQKAGLGIASYGMSDTSLEEVFLKVTNEAEAAQPDPTTGTSLLNRLQRKRQRWSKRKQSSSSTLEGNIPLVSDKGDESDEEKCESEQGLLEESGTDSALEESFEADNYGNAGNCTVTGCFLLLQQYKASFIKRFHHSKRYFKGFIAQIVLPAAFICLALVFKLLAPNPSNGIIELTPRTYPGKLYIPFKNFNTSDKQAVQMTSALTQPCGVSAYYLTAGLDQTICHKYLDDTESDYLYWTKPSNDTPPANVSCSCASGKQQCPHNIVAPLPPFLNTVDDLTLQDLADKKNMTDYILKSTDDYILHRYGGASFGHENDQFAEASSGPYHDVLDWLGVKRAAKAWYSNKAPHSPPIYLNVLNNAILRGHLNASENITQYGITTYSHPFNSTVIQQIQDKMRSGIDLLIALCVIFALSFVPPSFVMFLIRERATGAKHQQLVCGVNPVIYWISNYSWDMCNYMVTVVCIVIIFSAFGEDVYTSGDNFSAVTVLFILHGWAMIPLMYPATYIFTNSSTAYIVTMSISVLVGFVTTSTTLILQLIEQTEGGESSGGLSDQLRVAFLIFPNYCLGRGLMDMAFNYYITSANKELKSFGVTIDVPGPFSLNIDSVGRNILAMAVSGFVFFILTLLIEYKFFLPKLVCKAKINKFIVEKRDGEDEDVARERKRIVRGRARNSVLRLDNLTKVYNSWFSTSKVLAVDGLSLGVAKGECFGLLGVNGAGKTSTFKMLTGDVSVTAGNALVLGHSVKSDIHSVRQNIGYCPQFDAINDLLTGREHLALYARLKGVAEKEIPQVIEWCLRKLGLTQYAGVCAGKYSGGNKRKLSAAIALIGQPAIVFLDEPTTGMDPKSRRFLWSVINSLVQQGCSIIVTSHSMEECEALCTRIGIMVNGQLKCLGSPLHLKSRFGDGYTITVRLAGSFPDLKPTKTFFETTFPEAELKEQQHNLLEYQLPSSSAQLSFVFSQLETDKEKLNIQDYSISQTTLDRVFVHFAKQQGDGVSSTEPPRSLWGRFCDAFTSDDQKWQRSNDKDELSRKSLSSIHRFRVTFNAKKQQVQFEDSNEDPETAHLVQDQDESIA